MQFGFALYDSVLDTDRERDIGRLFEAGFTWIESQDPLHLIGRARFRRFAALLARLQAQFRPSVSVHLPITDLNPASENQSVRRLTLRQWRDGIRFAGDLGAVSVLMHPGYIGPIDLPARSDPGFGRACVEAEQAKNRVWPYLLDAVHFCNELARGYGMTLVVENVVGADDLISTPEEHARLLDSVQDDNVWAALDVGHAERAGCGWRPFLERLGARIRHIHLADNDGAADWHWPLGQGRIDFAALMHALTASGYSGALVMEIVADDWSAHVAGKAFLQRLARA